MERLWQSCVTSRIPLYRLSLVYKNPLLFFYPTVFCIIVSRHDIRIRSTRTRFPISLSDSNRKCFRLYVRSRIRSTNWNFLSDFLSRYERVSSIQASQFQDIITREIWSSSVVDSLWITLNIPVEPWRDRKRSTRNLFNKTTSIYQHRRTIVSTNHTFQPASLRSPYRFLSTREKEREREKILYTSRILLPFPSFLIDKCPART